MSEPISLVLPWPPSTNHLYATVRGHRILSREGKAYKQRVAIICRRVLGPREPIANRVHLSIYAHPPDKRARDLSNLLKIVEDSLTNAGVWIDDSLIDHLEVDRGCVMKDGQLHVIITEIQKESA